MFQPISYRRRTLITTHHPPPPLLITTYHHPTTTTRPVFLFFFTHPSISHLDCIRNSFLITSSTKHSTQLRDPLTKNPLHLVGSNYPPARRKLVREKRRIESNNASGGEESTTQRQTIGRCPRFGRLLYSRRKRTASGRTDRERDREGRGREKRFSTKQLVRAV